MNAWTVRLSCDGLAWLAGLLQPPVEPDPGQRPLADLGRPRRRLPQPMPQLLEARPRSLRTQARLAQARRQTDRSS